MCRPLIITALLWFGIVSSHAATQPITIIFQIGTPNEDFHDFALADNYKNYSKQFPNDVNFTVGKSDPKQDWPWIQPGPADGWAEKKPHPFKINFNIAKLDAGYYRLVIDYAGAHPTDPPTLVVDINGQHFQRRLPAGDNGMVLENFKGGKTHTFEQLIPPQMLRVGDNSITLTNITGSWAVYGDIRLESGIAAPPQTLTLQARPLPFFKQTPDGLQRAVNVSIKYLKGDTTPAELTWHFKDKSGTQKLDLHFGEDQQLMITVPDVDQIEFSLKAGQEQIDLPVALPPARKWLVYIVPTAHTDIGYTNFQDKVRERHADNGLTVLKAMDDDPEFKWYSETFWQLNALLQLHPEKTDEVFQRLREKRWGLSGDYANMLTGLCSSETLDRVTLNARNLANRGGFELNSVVMDDVPSAVGSMPMVLANSGIKYFIEGSNKFRAPYSGFVPNPFYWEGPDGSRVLSEIVHGYGQARRVIEKAPEQLPDFLAQFEKPDYPYDAVLVNGGFGDNALVEPWIRQAVQQWNSQWAYPKLIFALPEDFFGHIEKNFAGKIPVIKGDFGTWWEDGAGSTAVETALSRRAQERIVTAEMLHSLSGIIGKTAYPKSDFDKAWDNILLYNEHTWGATASVRQPNAELTTKQWEVKQANARDADSESRKLLDSGMSKLAAMVPKADLVVFNPLAWSRNAVVKVVGVGVLQDVDSPKKAFFTQGLPEGGSCMIAQDLPSVGYRTYRLVAWNEPVENAVQISGNQMENEFYRVTLNPKTGGIQSIFDKQMNRELVDPASEYNLGELIYVTGGDITYDRNTNAQLLQPTRFDYHRQSPTKIETTNGPVFGELASYSTAENFPSITMRVRLYRGLKQLDLIFELNKTETLKKEGVYLAFPFAVDPAVHSTVNSAVHSTGGGLWLEYPDEIVEPLHDQHASACRAWYSVQRWLAVSDGDCTVELSPLDTPLMTIGHMPNDTWPRTLSFYRGHVFSYIMNNYWHTNYKASQGGAFTCRYSITSTRGAFSKHDATIAGLNMYCPAVAGAGQADHKPLLTSPSQSLVAVQPLGLPLTAIKQSEDETGYILRLCDFAGEGGTATLTLPQSVQQLFNCNLVECNPHDLSQTGKTISVPVNKFAPVTLKARFEQ